MFILDFKSRSSICWYQLILPATIALLGSNTAAAQSVADFALGGHNICAIDTNGDLECTTRFDRATYLPPDDGTLYSAVSSGSAHSCAITQSGELRCWGLNNFGQLDAPTSAVAFVSLDAGEGHSCAIDANMQAHCWGLNTNGQTDVPEPNSGFVSVHASSVASCGIKQSGETVCWTTVEGFSENIPTNAGYTDLTVGGGSGGVPGCGLTQDGSIDCFFSRDFSVDPPTGGPYIDIEANSAFFCGVTTDGTLDCNLRVFNSASPNIDDQNTLNQSMSLSSLTSFELSAQGFPSTSICALTSDGDLTCIGENLPAPNVPKSDPTILPPVTQLAFLAYSDTSGELNWRSVPQPLNTLVFAGHNIYRDGEFVTFTNNATSFVVDDLEAGQTEYEVAAVGLDGTEGERASVVVSTDDRNAPEQSPSPAAPLAFDSQPTNFNIERYGDTSLEVFWDAPTNLFNPSYQVFRNGEFVANAPGASYFDDTVNPDTDYTYTIFVIRNSGNGVGGVGFAFEPSR